MLEVMTYYVVAESLSFLHPEGLTEALDQFVQLLGVTAQELPDVLQTLEAVGSRQPEISWTRFHLHGPGDAQDAVALLQVVVKGFFKQDGDRGWELEARPQQDLPVLDPDLLLNRYME